MYKFEHKGILVIDIFYLKILLSSREISPKFKPTICKAVSLLGN